MSGMIWEKINKPPPASLLNTPLNKRPRFLLNFKELECLFWLYTNGIVYARFEDFRTFQYVYLWVFHFLYNKIYKQMYDCHHFFWLRMSICTFLLLRTSYTISENILYTLLYILGTQLGLFDKVNVHFVEVIH